MLLAMDKRHKTTLGYLSALVFIGWCTVCLFSISYLGVVSQLATILIVSLVAILAEELIGAMRADPQINVRGVFNRKLLTTTVGRTSGIVVLLAAIEVAQVGGRSIKAFLIVACVGLLLLQIVRTRDRPRSLLPALLCWAGAVTLYFGMSELVPYGRLIGTLLLAAAILGYLPFPEGNQVGSKGAARRR